MGIHEWDSGLEDTTKHVKKAEEEQGVQPTEDCHFHLEGTSAETKRSSNTFYSDAIDSEHVELRDPQSPIKDALTFSYCSCLFQYHIYFQTRALYF